MSFLDGCRWRVLLVGLLLFHLSIAERHLRIVDPAFLVFLYRRTGAERHRADGQEQQLVFCSILHHGSFSFDIRGSEDPVVVIDQDAFDVL